MKFFSVSLPCYVTLLLLSIFTINVEIFGSLTTQLSDYRYAFRMCLSLKTRNGGEEEGFVYRKACISSNDNRKFNPDFFKDATNYTIVYEACGSLMYKSQKLASRCFKVQ